jgi:surface protein
MLNNLRDTGTFNADIGKWNTASVSNMQGIFSGVTAFNQNVAAWNVLRVSNLVSAFDSASALSSCNKGAIYRLWGATLRTAYPTWSGESSACLVDGNIGTAATAWATDPTTAAATYGNIADWNTAAVSNMYRLFYDKPTFNADIGKWNVASVSNMFGLFHSATAFNQNIASWNVVSVSEMYHMFAEARAFNRDIASWNVASVLGMACMFCWAMAFNQNLGGWNVASVTTMSGIFAASPFNQPIGGWNLARVNDITSMFSEASAFNQNIGGWNVASVSNMANAFIKAPTFNQNIAGWNVLRATTLTSAFDSASALSSCNKGAIYLAWGTTLRTAYPTFLSSGSSISSFSPLNTQVSGAAAVTVLGANFQCSDLSPSAYISGEPCATTAWTTTTQLVCAAPAPVLAGGVGREAWVKVFTNTASRGFSFDAAVASCGAVNGVPSGASSVTITGLSFSAADPSASGTLEMVACGTSSWTSATSLSCLSSSMMSTMVGLSAVSVGGVAGTSAPVFSFDAAVGSGAARNCAPSGGSSVTVTGLNFGAGELSASGSLTSVDACSTSTWTSATSVGCAPQAYGGSAAVRIAVSLSAVVGTLTGQLSFDGMDTRAGVAQA